MYSTLSVHFLPALTCAEELAAGVVVVIDVLRASTTITAALAAGASEIVPCLEVEEARQMATRMRADATQIAAPVLGGERGGLPIDGFDLGNSPREYTAETVWKRSIVFTTTNGTQAMRLCTAAQRVLIGSFVNYSATLALLTGERPIHLLCAGTRGKVTREDVLFAGALADRIASGAVAEDDLNDEARIARDAWRQSMEGIAMTGKRANQKLVEVLRWCQGGRNLMNVGLDRDIADVAEIDRYDFVPELDLKSWRITRR